MIQPQLNMITKPKEYFGFFLFNVFKENDLDFKKEDKIQVVKKTENGWWIGILDGKIGYFPYNFVAL